MLLKVSHTTRYSYDAPVPYALQQLRLRPKSRGAQRVISWEVTIEGGRRELSFEDEHLNTVDLISFAPGAQEITVHCTGEVEVTDTAGVVGPQLGCVPLWLFQRPTALTRAGAQVRSLVAGFDKPEDRLGLLHALSAQVLESLPYSTEQTSAELSAEQALTAGHGVCQDHAHVFIAAARHLGIPARYVSGYLLLEDGPDQDAAHAWAEAHVDGLGWVGFDVPNAVCPDDRYVRVATGLDYTGAAPVRGMRLGEGAEDMQVTLRVEQQ